MPPGTSRVVGSDYRSGYPVRELTAPFAGPLDLTGQERSVDAPDEEALGTKSGIVSVLPNMDSYTISTFIGVSLRRERQFLLHHHLSSGAVVRSG
jgi:hypothetical protein